MSWNDRIIYFDKKPRFVGKNIDVVLLNSSLSDDPVHDPKCFLACGEIKAGIDPAGADEHWKTAQTALLRVQDAFDSGQVPKVFFVGAIIVNSMADEMIKAIKEKTLNHVANLTSTKQLDALASWLVAL
ncbi:MAG: hypothetical protein JKY43_01205 [Phycisphaerales bacterium]|nr:hypothetical protein [Phycisphaerales bacterium]